MKFFYLLLCCFMFICCEEEETLNISNLKKNGYDEISCKDIEEYENEDARFIEFNKNFLVKNDFLVARCYDDDNCLIRMFKNKDKITCQRYVIDKSEEDKRDYFSIDSDYFTVHRTQYLFAEYDKHKVFYLSLKK